MVFSSSKQLQYAVKEVVRGPEEKENCHVCYSISLRASSTSDILEARIYRMGHVAATFIWGIIFHGFGM